MNNPCLSAYKTTTRKRLKRTLFNWTKHDKMHELSRKSSFSKLRTTQKQTIHFSFAGWILAEGRGHGTDVLKFVCLPVEYSRLSYLGAMSKELIL